MAPTILLQTLESVRRRVRVLTVLFGLGLAVAAAGTAVVASALLDYALNLPAFPRLLLIAASVVAVVYCLVRFVVKPLTVKLTLNDVAGRVERTFPQFEDRLRSTVDIVLGRDVPGSDVMKQRVVAETTRLSQSLDLSRVVVARPVWYSTGGAATAVAVLIMLGALVGKDYRDIAINRLAKPFGDHPWPKTVMIESAEDLPTKVAVGQRFDVAVKLTKGMKAGRKAVIHYQYGDASGQNFGPAEQEYMTLGDDGVFRASVDAHVPADAPAGLVKVWVESGDGEFKPEPIPVVQRLAIARVEAEVTAPSYANVPVNRLNLSQSKGFVTYGSRVRLTAVFNKPLDAAQPVEMQLLDGKKASPFKWEPITSNVAVATATMTDSAQFHLKATDVDGFRNTAAEEYELVVKPDQTPTIVIEEPRRNEDRTAEATFPVQAVAEDDFGVSTVSLMVDRMGDKKHWEIPLVAKAAPVTGVQWTKLDVNGDIQRFRVNYEWTLSTLADAGLRPGDVLEYYAVVTDNFNLEGQTHPPVASGKLRITIISQDDFKNWVHDVLGTIGEQTGTLKQAQQTTARQTSATAEEVKAKPQLDNADKTALDRLNGQEGTIASQTKTLANKVGELRKRMDQNKLPDAELKDIARDVQTLLDSAAENPMKAAAGDLNNAKQSPTPDDRNKQMNDAAASEAKAADTLSKVLGTLGDIGGFSRAIDAVRDALDKQRDLTNRTAEQGKKTIGKTPEQMTPEERDAMNKLAREQADLGKKTQAMIEQMQKDAGALEKKDPVASNAMKQSAETGNQQNVPGNQSKASDAESQNRQSDAQSGQKQAEQGLTMMLNDLKEAQKRKLDELAKKLAQLQQQVAILIREQAGHNLDNLSLQGMAAIAKVSEQTKLQLFTLSERDPKSPPPAVDLGLLSAGQEQTERNCRDIAKSAEDLPEGGDPAAQLTKAADKMERAIVNLRDTKLAEAYSPAQVDALDALLAAKKLVDAQKKEADKKSDDQKKEKIRQAYMAIMAQQLEVDAETLKIDGLPKNPDGTLTRAAEVQLKNLPARQGRAADMAQKLDEDLSLLGSIVYTFANLDIVKNMNEVKERLNKQSTGAGTQAREAQIIAELDAMIRDLTPDPEKIPFDQKSKGGGGGGKNNKGLPTEAELRLIKDLQIAVNNVTVDLSKADALDRTETKATGDRQGDLRGLLDQVIQKASQGQGKLPPEPPVDQLLPEETNDPQAKQKAVEHVDDDELNGDLLGGDKQAKGPDGKKEPNPDHELAVVGDRMARSKQRLAIKSDPGVVTQEIQKRILENLDDLINQAREKQANAQNQPPQPGEPGEKKDQKDPKDAKAENQKQGGEKQADGGQAPATTAGGGGAAGADAANDLARQEAKMWGGVSARERQAINETATEVQLQKYKKLIDDYYRAMSAKANGGK